MWETNEMKDDEKGIDDVKGQDLWETVKEMMLAVMCEESYEMKGNEETYVKKGNKKEIDDVKGQTSRMRSMGTIKSNCWMSRWSKRQCGLQLDESQRSRPLRSSRIT